MSSDLSTPSKVNRSSCDRSHCLNEDVCSVCLSPVKSDHHSTPSSSSKGGPVQTICKHTFHSCCLLTARRWKSECPLCRTALSPIIQQIQWAQSTLIPSREEIVQTANRVRNAMRAGILRRGTAATVA